MAQLASTKPTKFTDVPPGSRILITDRENPGEPWEALALDVVAEHGPGRAPAIFYIPEGGDSTEMITATGRYEVQVLTSSASLAALSNLENVITGRSRVVNIQAAQYVGGLESARDCIMFAAGRAAIMFDANADPQTLTVGGKAPQIAKPGDWIVVELRDDVNGKPAPIVRVVSSNDFAATYEVTE